MNQNNCPSINEQALVVAFSQLKDPRVKGRCLHQLIDILIITICAILCGAKLFCTCDKHQVS